MPEFSLLISEWYRLNCRKLPWRETNDPYRIWLSEIILQQTRVDQGLSYYNKFIKNYPTVHDLANASERDILNDWQGLGYYSRARNLHAAARFIRDERKGHFPSNYIELRQLKGVGEYTAAAIASFAFGEAKAVVDGNVYRLLSRYFDLNIPIDTTKGKREFQKLADSLLDHVNPGVHNQAIMELGAMICSPKPSCGICPLHDICLSHANQSIANRPVKTKQQKVRNRYFHFLIYLDNGHTWIEQRKHKDIWRNMYQFPLVESEETLKENELELLSHANKASEVVIHQLSHQQIHAQFYHIYRPPERPGNNWLRTPISDMQDYPIPRLIDRYLEKHPLNSDYF